MPSVYGAVALAAILPQVLVSFSVRSNLQKLVGWSPSELGLDCVLGIKFYCMLLITAGHGVVFLVTGPITNADFVQQVGVDATT